MSRTWRSAPRLNNGKPWGRGARCPSCLGPRLVDGRCVVSGHTSWCESSGAIDGGERWGWTPQPNGNREAVARVREARREYREAMKEARP